MLSKEQSEFRLRGCKPAITSPLFKMPGEIPEVPLIVADKEDVHSD